MAVHEVGPTDRLIITGIEAVIDELGRSIADNPACHLVLLPDPVDVFIVRNGRTSSQQEERNALD